MNLGFDFDKIFIDYPPFIPDAVIDRLYKKRASGKLSYRIPSKPEQIFRRFTHHPLLRPPIEENIKTIKKLVQNKQHKHYLISSRFDFLKNATQHLIKKHQFDNVFDGVFFNFENEQPHLFKDKIVKKLHIHRYVDDDLRLLEFLISKNPTIICFWLNKTYKGLLKRNLFGITKLSSILDNI